MTKNKISPKYNNQIESYVTLIEIVKQLKGRLDNKNDNVIAISGYEGVGKTSLAFWIYYLLNDGDLSKWEDDIFFSEKATKVIDKIKESPERTSFWFDEAVNQFSKKDWNTMDARLFSKEFTVNRNEFNNYLLCLPNFLEFVKGMRTHRIKFWFFVTERGQSLLAWRDTKSPISKGSWHLELLEYGIKNRFHKRAKTPTTKDVFRLWKKMPNTRKRKIRFPPMPVLFEKRYNVLKNERKRISAGEKSEFESGLIKTYKTWIQNIVNKYQIDSKTLQSIGMSRTTAHRYLVAVPPTTRNVIQEKGLVNSTHIINTSPYNHKGKKKKEEEEY
jgi:hypothetical protein